MLLARKRLGDEVVAARRQVPRAFRASTEAVCATIFGAAGAKFGSIFRAVRLESAHSRQPHVHERRFPAGGRGRLSACRPFSARKTSQPDHVEHAGENLAVFAVVVHDQHAHGREPGTSRRTCAAGGIRRPRLRPGGQRES